jgi:hypothetical protein
LVAATLIFLPWKDQGMVDGQDKVTAFTAPRTFRDGHE